MLCWKCHSSSYSLCHPQSSSSPQCCKGYQTPNSPLIALISAYCNTPTLVGGAVHSSRTAANWLRDAEARCVNLVTCAPANAPHAEVWDSLFPVDIIDTARMRSGVYVTVGRPSVGLIVWQPFAAEHFADRTYRSTAAAPAPSMQQRRRSTALTAANTGNVDSRLDEAERAQTCFLMLVVTGKR